MILLIFYFNYSLNTITLDYCMIVFLLTFILVLLVLGGPFSMSSFINLDLVSWSLTILAIFLLVVMLMGSVDLATRDLSSQYYMFLMGTLMLIVCSCFSVLNSFLFYLFFECSIVPIFLIILGWGYSYERLSAGLYLFIYTLSFSLPFLLFLVYISEEGSLSDLLAFLFYYDLKVSLFWSFATIMVFLVKLPMFGIHLWLPKAHVEAPMAGSMALAGVLLKLGAYGFIRFYLFFVGFMKLNCFIFWGGLTGSLYSFAHCFRQVDMKCLVAYMSVSHMSMLASVYMSMKYYSMYGFIIMMISHGFSSSGLFGLLGICYSRVHSRSMMMMKSNFFNISVMGLWGFLISISSMSCPPSMNFFSEIFLVLGLFSFSSYFGFVLFFMGFMGGSLSVMHFFIILFHGKMSHLFIMPSVTLLESIFMMLHIAPLLMGFLVF